MTSQHSIVSAQAPIEFSVLITCYYEERSIDEFYSRLSNTLKNLGRSYEIIFVNDGSRDGTWKRLNTIFDRDPHVHAILDMSKNSGQQAAVTAAVAESSGAALVLLDSDLQLAPEELPLLVEMYDKGFDLVTGYRQNRKDSLFRIIPSLLANIIMRRASRSGVRDFGCTFKIYNACLVRAFEFGPRRIFSNVELISRIDRIAEVPVTHYPRKYGSSGWTFAKLLKYNTDNVIIVSERPFQYSATVCMFFAALFVARIVLDLIFPMHLLPQVSNGLLLNAIIITLLVTVALLSFVGEFAIRSFLRAHSAPAYVVREKRCR